MQTRRLQDGIYWDSGQVPPRCFAMAFLRLTSQATKANAVHSFLAGLWAMLQALRKGEVADLPGLDNQDSGLDVLLGFGPKAFVVQGIRRAIPEALSSRYSYLSARNGGGNLILAGSGLRYKSGIVRNAATEEFVLQFTGETPLSVNRAVVEVWKYVFDRTSRETGSTAIELSSFYTGFNREDKRSWLDFHDGVSNLQSGQERYDAIAVHNLPAESPDKWTELGTYMTFMRAQVNLTRWRGLNHLRSDSPDITRLQEQLVGRAKRSGCPVSHFDASGYPVSDSQCPLAGTSSVVDDGNELFRVPPDAQDERIRTSHVQRANHHVEPVSDDNSLRIYRQGYEFLAGMGVDAMPDLGLNFVAFMRHPSRLQRMLTTPGWLGRINFGGMAGGGPELLSVEAAANFLVPSVIDGEPFPGAGIFE